MGKISKNLNTQIHLNSQRNELQHPVNIVSWVSNSFLSITYFSFFSVLPYLTCLPPLFVNFHYSLIFWPLCSPLLFMFIFFPHLMCIHYWDCGKVCNGWLIMSSESVELLTGSNMAPHDSLIPLHCVRSEMMISHNISILVSSVNMKWWCIRHMPTQMIF